jgi:hypothetical protein
VGQRAGGARGVGVGGDRAGARWWPWQQPDRFGLAGYRQDERLGDVRGARHGGKIGDSGGHGEHQDRVHGIVGRDLFQAAAEDIRRDGRGGIDGAPPRMPANRQTGGNGRKTMPDGVPA